MHKQQRLKKRREFAAVYQRGRLYAHKLVALRVLPNGAAETRFGFSVARSIGKAVARNRVKRRLREGVRTLSVAPGWDIVISARHPAAATDYDTLQAALAGLFSRAGVLRQECGEGERKGE
jgi:ribonuclease P protein component